MWGIIIALLSGALMSVQGVFNTEVTKSSGIWVANAFVQATAFLVCLAAWCIVERTPVTGLFKVEPKYMLLGGVIGAFITFTVIKSMETKAILKIAEEVHAVIGITKDKKFIGYLPSMTEREKCLRWGQRVIDETHKAFGEQKVYVSVGLASNDEKVENYEDLFQLCDRAVNLARERGKNVALYY